MKGYPAQTSFAGGELSPLLEGRTDIEKYPIGCRRLRNFFPLIQGPARFRGGAKKSAVVKSSTNRTWLRDFVFSETDALVLEFGDEYVRFYKNREPVIVDSAPTWSNVTTYDPGDFVTYSGVIYYALQSSLNEQPDLAPLYWVEQSIYEIPSPYQDADLLNEDGGFALAITQSADVLYIASGIQPYTLSRYADTDWRFEAFFPEDGPFDTQNIDNTVSVTVSAETGTVTITNDATDIPIPTNTTQRLIRVEETNRSDVAPWEPDKLIADTGENPVGELRRSDGHVYECTTDEVAVTDEIRTGTIKPVHTEGIFADGDGKPIKSDSTTFAIRAGVDWEYLHSGYGVGNITACDGTDATVTTVLRWPASTVSDGSYRWAMGAWYDGNYPLAVGFYRDRLGWAGGQRVWLSVSGAYDSHAPDEFGEILADSAIDVTISVGSLDSVKWIVPQADGLLIGTGGAELLLSEISRNQVFGPQNVKFELQSSFGSRKVPPLVVGEYTLFVQQGGRSIIEAQYASDQARFVGIDMTVFSEHILGPGVVGMAYCQNPDRQAWFLRSDGKVACMTYNRAESVIAWSLHDFGGFVESICSVPSPTPGIDDLYLIVRRTLNCDALRIVEVLTQPHTQPFDPIEACYYDCATTYDGAQDETLQPGYGAVTAGAEEVFFTTGGNIFVSGDVGRYIVHRWFDSDDEVWMTAKALITEYTNATEVKCTILSPFPVGTTRVSDGGDPPLCVLPTTPLEIEALDWRLTTTTVTGLDYLIGETVGVTIDGASQAQQVVSEDGTLTLPRAGAVVHVGLPYTGVVQLMNLDAGTQDGTAQARVKKISNVTFRFFESWGGKAGNSVSTALPLVFRQSNMDLPPDLYSGDIKLNWPHGYETQGRITFVHDQGTPCTLVAVYPEVETHGKQMGPYL